MSYLNSLREQRAKIVADAREILEDVNVAEAEREHKFDALMVEADKVKANIDRAERLGAVEANLGERNAITAAARGVSVAKVEDEAKAQEDAFTAYLRYGFANLTDEQRRIAAPRIQAAQSVGTGSSGGYTVPQGFYDKLDDALKAYGGMMETAFVLNTETGNVLPIPTDNDTTNAGAILTENTQVSTQDVSFGTVSLGAYTYTSKLILVSNQLLQDSAFDLNSFLADKMGTRIARAVNAHLTVGTGSGQPNGVVTGSTLGKTGAAGQTASITFDDLIDLHHSVDPAYRPNAKFMLADDTLRVVKKLKDGQGRYLWQPGLPIQGEPDTIDGKPYVINQDMPVMETSAKSVLFGDFSKYFIRKVAGTQVLRLTERYADYNQTGFLAFQRWDGVLVDAGTHPLKYYQNSAS